MDSIVLHRVGYGSSFNSIYIHGDELEKKPRNEYGQRKLELEKNAYRHFYRDVPEFPLAKGFYQTDTSLFIKYYKDYVPLWQLYIQATFNQREVLLQKILHYLSLLHSKKLEVPYDEYSLLLRSEVVEKVYTRYTEIAPILESYPFTSVNGTHCLSFDECMRLIKEYLERYLQTRNVYSLCYIHGDPQFNNILSNKDLSEFVFIDPRGYFGSKELFGLEEYDTAKVLFALSGYDVFDSSEQFELTINDGNIQVPDFSLDKQYISLYPEIHFILCSIWLANAHCFKTNPSKLVISHAYARYLTTRLLHLNLECEVSKDFN
jgi:hypothetical protein